MTECYREPSSVSSAAIAVLIAWARQMQHAEHSCAVPRIDGNEISRLKEFAAARRLREQYVSSASDPVRRHPNALCLQGG